MRNKHIAIFVTQLTMGGVQKTRIQLAKSLAQEGFQVDFFYKRPGELGKDIPQSIKTIQLKGKKNWQHLMQIMPYIWQDKPSILLASSRNYNPLLLWAKRLAGYPLILLSSLHGACSFESLHRVNKRRLRTKKGYLQFDGLIAVSQGVAEDCSQVLDIDYAKFKVLYNPVVTSDIFNKAKASVHHPWFQDKQTSLILGIGRLEQQKRFEHLIQAFARVKDKISARLVIFGDGSQRKALEELIDHLGLQDRIDLPGFVENPYSYFKQADLFVLSSEHEGLPGVLIQALALGVPVVATDCISGPKEILQNGKYGCLVPVGDIEALSKAMLATLANPLSSEYLQTAIELFKEEYTIAAYKNYLEGYLCAH